MTKKKQGTLEGMPDINGRVIDTIDVIVMVPKVISGVEVRKLDNDRYRIMHGEQSSDGDTWELAIKAFKRMARDF